ncbi:HpcH/HpaI aldolase family protein [Rhizobium panacihumi]|uniref:HpcH/HpaI aldolase family protein n=1 Tax=Rhizobium panacihumi TaxID=2008450 RepID=UPI003D7A8874
MSILINPLKRALQAGKLQIGLFSQLGNPVTVEMIAGSGFDWIGIDTEHGPTDLVALYSQLQACGAANGVTSPAVRLPSNDRILIKQYLDIGVQNIIIPQVDTAEQARAIVWETRYAPRGGRGYCGAPRASNFGRIKDYPFKSAEEICVIVQPESMKAIENLEAVAEVDGVDCFFFGPGDLSADMGYLHQATHPEVVKVLESAAKRVRAAGKAAGIICPNEELCRHYIDVGFNFVEVGSDQGILVRGADDLAAKFMPLTQEMKPHNVLQSA